MRFGLLGEKLGHSYSPELHAFFGDYLDGKRPFRWHHYFELHYFKQFVKRILGVKQ